MWSLGISEGLFTMEVELRAINTRMVMDALVGIHRAEEIYTLWS